MRRKAWWAAGTVAAVSLAGLVTAGIAATSSAGEDDREIKNKDGKRGKRVVRIVSPGFGGKGAFLGVHTVEETDGDDGGARVETVVEGSPADEAGIQEGDVIVAFDGHTVRGPVALTEYIHETEPKEKVTVTVLRDGRRKTLDVEMGQRARGLLIPGQVETIEVPLPDSEALQEHLKGLEGMEMWKGKGPRAFSFYFGGRPKLGVQLVETTPELRDHLGGGRDRGVLVGKVMRDTPAEKAGVQVGDLLVAVDGEDVASTGDLVEQLSEKDGRTIRLELVRDGRTMTLEVAIPEAKDDEDEGGPRAAWELSEERRRAVELALDELRQVREERRTAMRDATERVREELRAVEEARADARRVWTEDVQRAREELRRARIERERALARRGRFSAV